MNITINDHIKILTLQEEFNSYFPYLKLEFFSKPQKSSGMFSKKYIKHKNRTLGECRTIHNKGEIIIQPQMKVTDLDRDFMNIYGLGVMVFRKSGKVWLETTLTEHWTLEEQNLQGEALSNKVV